MIFEEWGEKLDARRLRFVLAMQMYGDWKDDRERAAAREKRLREALVKAAIPLEALDAAVEWELHDAVKRAIREAIDVIRSLLIEEAPHE